MPGAPSLRPHHRSHPSTCPISRMRRWSWVLLFGVLIGVGFYRMSLKGWENLQVFVFQLICRFGGHFAP